MTEWLISGFILLAAVLVLLASIGLLRLPDLPTRMHATTKSGVLAIILVMLGVALYFREFDVVARTLAIIAFIVITAPVAAHAIGRAGYLSGIQLWSETQKDELAEYYQKEGKSTQKPTQ
jgi:multicomponent Na+:H+ antiporter subunit G